MSDPSHDLRIARLFSEPAPFPDAAQFTAAVQRRLERRWRGRRAVIGLAGLAGGVIAAAQVLEADLVGRASALTAQADVHAQHLAATWLGRGGAVLHLAALGSDGQVLWMIAGLGAVGVALVAGRLLEGF